MFKGSIRISKLYSDLARIYHEMYQLIFDNFNAKEIFLNFKQELIQTSTYNNRKYKRVSNNSMNLETGWTWNWDATYYIE